MLFAGGSTFYLNLLSAHEVFRQMSATKQLHPYTPPSQRVAVLRCLAVLLPCALISSMGAWRVLPHEGHLLRGLVCFPSGSNIDGRLSSLLVPVIFPLLIGLPTVLLVPLALLSWRRKLHDFGVSRFRRVVGTSDSSGLHAQAAHRLRIQQARKACTVCLARTLAVTLLWYPAIGVMALQVHSPLAMAIGLALIFVCPIVLSYMSLNKTEVRQAVIDLLGPLLGCMCTSRRIAAWKSEPGTGFVTPPSQSNLFKK